VGILKRLTLFCGRKYFFSHKMFTFSSAIKTARYNAFQRKLLWIQESGIAGGQLAFHTTQFSSARLCRILTWSNGSIFSRKSTRTTLAVADLINGSLLGLAASVPAETMGYPDG
jgi:hypothetical protein